MVDDGMPDGKIIGEHNNFLDVRQQGLCLTIFR
jgi:hypothetical protein